MPKISQRTTAAAATTGAAEVPRLDAVRGCVCTPHARGASVLYLGRLPGTPLDAGYP